jgi:hypothetical protein
MLQPLHDCTIEANPPLHPRLLLFNGISTTKGYNKIIKVGLWLVNGV